MSKCAIAVVAVIVAGCSLSALKGEPPTAGSPPPAAPERAFAGKILVIHLKSDPEATLTIEDPAISRLGDRGFLVGVCVDHGDEEEWRGGLTVWTAVDDISQIVEVRDRDELKKRLQEAPEKEHRPTKA